LIRVFLVAAVCVAALTAWTPAALGQVVEAPADIGIAGDPPPPPPPEPAPEPPPAPEPAPDPGPAAELPPNNPPVDEQPAQEPAPPPQEESRPVVHADSGTTRSEPARDNVPAATPGTAVAPRDVFEAPAPLPPGSAGDDFAFTEQGDAFVLGSGGADDGGSTAVLGSFTRFASIATAASRIPALGGRDRAARQAAQAAGSGARLVLVDSSGHRMLFFNLFGGGGGGGAALVFLTALGMLTIFRMVPPDWNSAFRNSTAVWRPSAYVPPIEHPG
jgi:hypothetical protein